VIKISSWMDSLESILYLSDLTMWTSRKGICTKTIVLRNFWLGGKGIEETEIPGVINEKSIIERHEVFARYHDSIMGHLGVERTLMAMSFRGHAWTGMRQNVSNWIGECEICHKIKYQRLPDSEDYVEHHLYSLSPLTTPSVDTLGALKEDENENCLIKVIVDNFSKLIGLYPAKNTTSKDYFGALLQ